MPPTCSPKKHGDTEITNNNCMDNDFQYITPPTSTLRTMDRIEDHRITNLIQEVPQISNIFDVLEHIGEGTFSYVFLASLRNDPTKSKKFALKHLIPTVSPERAMFELKCLQDMGGKDNIVGIELCLRHEGNIVFVMPYMRHDQFQQFVHKMNAKELAFYMRNLMLALARVHSFGIIHRDIKPNNFLYDRINKKFTLVDFGLAQLEPAKKHEHCIKRKRENSPDNFMTSDAIKQVSKKTELSTIPQNSTATSANEIKLKERTRKELNEKENQPIRTNQQGNNALALKSPFKSPLKSNSVNIQFPKKSPFKFPGLDLPPNHSTAGKRRLFEDDTETTFSKPKPPQTATTAKASKQKSPQPRTKTKSPKGLMVFTTSLASTASKNEEQRSSKQHRSQRKCDCYGKPTICNVCLKRKNLAAPRAGTPGFRPPEVLLKSPDQTTAVDIWASGVIMMCILSGCYPLFQSLDDYHALAEIITLFGDQSIKRVAHLLGRHFICSERKQPLDLRKVCCRLRQNETPTQSECDRKRVEMCVPCMQVKENCLCINVPMTNIQDEFPAEAYHLLYGLLDVNPKTRLSALQALEHPFLKNTTKEH